MSSFDPAIAILEKRARRELATWRNPPRELWLPGCSYTGRKGCDLEPRYEVSVSYVTGRLGRVTKRRKVLCEEHARAWAQAHGVELPELPARASLTIASLEVTLEGDVDEQNAQALESLAVFQSALRKAFKP